jgi:predicted O-methyltransferase YrrM
MGARDVTGLLESLRTHGAWWDGHRSKNEEWYPEGIAPGLDAVLRALLARYAEELAELDPLLRETRERIESHGGVTQFADAEAALLYSSLRETTPETVFEISPADGWSTNHILAALTRNGRGRLHSFELSPVAHDGTPTEEALRRNLHPDFDADRLEVHIGDARETVPAVPGQIDALLLDSAHEAWFAEWYLAEVLPRTRGVCGIHDIVGLGGAVKHQRYFDGEAYAILEWLGAYRIAAVPAAELETAPTAERRLPLDSYLVLLGVDGAAAPWDGARPRAALQQADLALAYGDSLAVHDLLEEALAAAGTTTPHLLLQIGERYRRLGLVERARELAERVGDDQRDEPLWLLQAGRTLTLLGRPVAGRRLTLRASRHPRAPRWVQAQSPFAAVSRRGRALAGRLRPGSAASAL